MRKLASTTVEWEVLCMRILPSKGLQAINLKATVTFSYQIDLLDSVHPPISKSEIDAIRKESIDLWSNTIITPYYQERCNQLMGSKWAKDLEISPTQLIGLEFLPTTAILAHKLGERVFNLAPKSVYQVDLTLWDSPDVGISVTQTRVPGFFS